MFGINLGLYILCLAFIWGFFIVAKIHFFKYREYSKHLVLSTKFVMIALLLLSILGLYFVINISSNSSKISTPEEQAIEEVY